MKKYKLRINQQFVSPAVWRDLGSEKYTCVVGEKGLTVKGFDFIFLDENDCPNEGEEVLFWMGNWGYCYIKSEYDNYQVEQANIREATRQADIALFEDYKADAEYFYKNLDFPVKYRAGIKEVLSGLSANSWGNARQRNTVIHLILLEDYKSGKLKRNKGEFLCSQQARYGNWSGSNDEDYYVGIGRGETEIRFIPKISCKTCLKRIKKYQKVKATMQV